MLPYAWLIKYVFVSSSDGTVHIFGAMILICAVSSSSVEIS